MYELKMTRDEAMLLQRAAMAGLKGSRPVRQDKGTAEALLGKLFGLADMILAGVADTDAPSPVSRR